MDNARFPEFGAYLLPGFASNNQTVFKEIQDAERLGIGSVWISERLNTKSADVISGAAAALSPNLGIATGMMSPLPLRHPLVTAGYASTMAMLTHNRFALGIGRGIDSIVHTMGVARSTFAFMEDYIRILRDLWSGKTVTYSGPAGTLNELALGVALDPLPPIITTAMGDKTLRWAGRHCDGVLLNSLWSPQAVQASIKLIRQGAEEAGRDPASVKVWTILVTACDVPEEAMLQYVIRRMNTYVIFPPMFDQICDVNGWDKDKARQTREAVIAMDGGRKGGLVGDEHSSRKVDDLRRMRDLYPESWIEEGNAVGSADHCARKAADRFAAGADGVLFHGCSPGELESLLAAWPKYRPAGLEGRSANPGL